MVLLDHYGELTVTPPELQHDKDRQKALGIYHSGRKYDNHWGINVNTELSLYFRPNTIRKSSAITTKLTKQSNEHGGPNNCCMYRRRTLFEGDHDLSSPRAAAAAAASAWSSASRCTCACTLDAIGTRKTKTKTQNLPLSQLSETEKQTGANHTRCDTRRYARKPCRSARCGRQQPIPTHPNLT